MIAGVHTSSKASHCIAFTRTQTHAEIVNYVVALKCMLSPKSFHRFVVLSRSLRTRWHAFVACCCRFIHPLGCSICLLVLYCLEMHNVMCLQPVFNCLCWMGRTYICEIKHMLNQVTHTHTHFWCTIVYLKSPFGCIKANGLWNAVLECECNSSLIEIKQIEVSVIPHVCKRTTTAMIPC